MVPVSAGFSPQLVNPSTMFWVSKSPVSLRNNLEPSPLFTNLSAYEASLSTDDFPPHSTKNIGAHFVASAPILFSLQSQRKRWPSACSRLIHLLVNQLIYIKYLLYARYCPRSLGHSGEQSSSHSGGRGDRQTSEQENYQLK